MNGKLREFLNSYGFEYHFQSSQEAYKRGDFNEGLSILLSKVEQVRALILPTLGEEKRDDWSPFFPICAQCGRVYTTRVTAYHPEDNTLDYVCDHEVPGAQGCGHAARTSIFNGKVKVGWKVDWALRWYSYGVDYEMYGKDLIESAQLSGKITRLMGKEPPIGFFYEMFLDKDGQKISKSVGKGLTVDAWTSYAPIESLLYFIFANPRKAKKLYWEIVPKCVDDYLEELRKYPTTAAEDMPNLPVWHIYDRGDVPVYASSVSYSTVDNLLSALATDSPELVMEYLERYDPQVQQYAVVVKDIVEKVLRYYRDFVLPTKVYRKPDEREKAMLLALRDRLVAYQGDSQDELQAMPFEVAKQYSAPPAELFKLFYETLLGQDRGPRFGAFTLLVGKGKLISLLEQRCV